MTPNSVRDLECAIIFQNWPSYKNFDPHIFVHHSVQCGILLRDTLITGQLNYGTLN